MPTLTASTPASINSRVAFAGADVAGDQLRVGMTPLDFAHRFDHARRMAVRRVDDEAINARFDQLVGAFLKIAGRADRGRDAQAARDHLSPRSDI